MGMFTKNLGPKNQRDIMILLLIVMPMLQLGCSSVPREADRGPSATPFKAQTQKAWDSRHYLATAEYHFAVAQAFSHEGKTDRAIEEYLAALTYDPQSSMLYGKLSAEYLRKGAVSLAIDAAKKSVQLDPSSVDSRILLGSIYSMNREENLALKEYEAVLKIDSKHEEATIFKAQSLIEQERIPEALRFVQIFVKRVPESAAGWYYIGKLEQMQDRTQAAIVAFRKAIDARPGFSQATLSLGMLLEVTQKQTEAKDLYEEQMEQRPDAVVAGRLAVIYLKREQFDQAQRVLEMMAQLDPEDLSTHLKLGLVHMQKLEWARAKEIFETILKKIPDSDKVHYYLATVHEESGDFPKAIHHFTSISPDSRLFEEAHLHASLLYRKLLQPARATELVEAAIKKSPENPGLYLMLAGYQEEKTAIKLAAETLKAGLKFFPDHEKLRYYHATLLDKLGQSDEAIVEMEKILKENPQHADALNFIGYTWTMQGVRLYDAQEYLQKALKLKPDSPFILDSVGWNQFMLGQHREALKSLEKAFSLKADEITILEHLVEVYSRVDMPERAKAVEVELRRLTSKSGDRSPASLVSP